MFDEFRRFERIMNRMLEEIWEINRSSAALLPGEIERYRERYRRRRPFIDVMETDKEVVATAEMPGLEKGDIKINLTDDTLEISAETRHEEEKREKDFIYKERRSGSYYRSVSLPSPIEPNRSTASYNNGVLQITMPKIEIKKKTSLKVN